MALWVECLRRNAANLVFNVLVSNTDDHLRHHGFVHDGIERGWFTKWYDCWKPF